jgi:hypothetical protein
MPGAIRDALEVPVFIIYGSYYDHCIRASVSSSQRMICLLILAALLASLILHQLPSELLSRFAV